MERIILAFNLIKDYLAIIYKYIISNNLNIDKGTFFYNNNRRSNRIWSYISLLSIFSFI